MIHVRQYALFLDGFLYGQGTFKEMNTIISKYREANSECTDVAMHITPLFSLDYHRIMNEMNEINNLDIGHAHAS